MVQFCTNVLHCLTYLTISIIECPCKQFIYLSDILLYIYINLAHFLKSSAKLLKATQSTLDTYYNYTTFLFVVKYKFSSFESADRQGCGRCRLYRVLRYQKCLHHRKCCYRTKIPEYAEGNERDLTLALQLMSIIKIYCHSSTT